MDEHKPPRDREQANRFAEAARAVGADDDEAAFRAKLATVARHKPKGDVPPVPPEPKPKKG